jgi:hypothetical protein
MATVPNKNIQECVGDEVKWGAKMEMAKTSLQWKRECLEAETAVAETLCARPQTRRRLVEEPRQHFEICVDRPSKVILQEGEETLNTRGIEDFLSERLSLEVPRFEC